jgi:hypothetical protein
MNSKTLKVSTGMVCLITLFIGLLISAFLTARNLPDSSSPEFWTEFFTGTGTQFILYGFPYVLFASLLRKSDTTRNLVMGAIITIALGLIMIAISVTAQTAIRPEDVPIFDSSIVIVFIQLVSIIILASLQNPKH